VPITPVHLGPGLLIKALAPGAFSLLVFGYAQVLIDLQPLVALSTGKGAVHGMSHTWIGAMIIGAVAAATGRPLANAALRRVRGAARRRVAVSWPVALTSAFVGTLSHVALDSLIYADMHPLEPWSRAQPGLGTATPSQVYLACLACGAIGAALTIVASWRRARREVSRRKVGERT
jgi:hypothetical protein